MSIQRVLNVAALILFVVFVATFFTVLVRLSKVGLTTERAVYIAADPTQTYSPVSTTFELLGQDPESGYLKYRIKAKIDLNSGQFGSLQEGDRVVMRIENVQEPVRGTTDLEATFSNPTADRSVTLDYGTFELEVPDRRDFYPFDGYEVGFNFAYFIPGHFPGQSGYWFDAPSASIKSLTNLIFIAPKYSLVLPDVYAFRMRVARLRMQQFLTATLILIEILFLLYLLTIVDMQEFLAKCLGYLVVVYVIRNILAANEPQFPTIIDYDALFLICATFFLMLFKFLGRAEERTLLTIPAAWRGFFMTDRENPEASADEKASPGKSTGSSED